MRLLSALVIAGALSPAHALTIRNDHGGFVSEYEARYDAMAARGEQARVMGVCNSACALVLARPNVCAGPRARFGFHRAYAVMSKTDLRYVGDSPDGTAYLMDRYPARVRAWIAKHGGLTKGIKSATGKALGVPPCL
jgi:hypothetical protein